MRIVFSHTAMEIGGIVFSLVATGIHGVVFRRATLVIGIVVFCRATLAIRGIVIFCTTTAIHSKHNNQPKEGRGAKMLATEAKQQATTSWHNKRMRGQRNMNVSATTAKGTMTMATVSAETTIMMTTTLAADEDGEGPKIKYRKIKYLLLLKH
jgi:hypothetical protein